MAYKFHNTGELVRAAYLYEIRHNWDSQHVLTSMTVAVSGDSGSSTHRPWVWFGKREGSSLIQTYRWIIDGTSFPRRFSYTFVRNEGSADLVAVNDGLLSGEITHMRVGTRASHYLDQDLGFIGIGSMNGATIAPADSDKHWSGLVAGQEVPLKLTGILTSGQVTPVEATNL